MVRQQLHPIGQFDSFLKDVFFSGNKYLISYKVVNVNHDEVACDFTSLENNINHRFRSVFIVLFDNSYQV